MLGDNANVYVDADGAKAILKVDPREIPETDKPVTFSVPYGSACLFDGVTENVIL